MTNSILVRIMAPLLIASIVLSGCAATNTDMTVASDPDVVSETTAVSDLDVAGDPSAQSSDTLLMEPNEPSRGLEAAKLFGGLLLFPIVLAVLFEMSSVGLY